MHEGLREALDGYRPADATEAGHLARMLRLVEDPAAMSRKLFVPGHFTASVFALSPDRRGILLIYHRTLERWLQPGGHLESTDLDIVAAARRELAEEAGVVDIEDIVGQSPIFDVDVHRIPANPRKGEPSHEHFDVRVLVRARTFAIRATAEVGGARWVDLAAVDTVETDESVRRAVRKLR